MDTNTALKNGRKALEHAEEKCRVFLDARTGKEGLAALQHVSQLVHLLPDETVREVARIARKSPDFEIRFEERYLAARWIRRFRLGFMIGGAVLLLLCLITLIVGIAFKLPPGLTVALSYVSGALAVEAGLVSLILRYKENVVSRNQN
jgi:hypothetical protein